MTPYPPMRDGIATYAAQAVRQLRAEGHDVEVLSPGPSAAHYHLDLVGPRGALALGKRVPRYDKVIVQFHPDFFYPLPSSVRDRIEVSLALAASFRLAREVEVVVHEIDYRHGRLRSPDGYAARALWHSVDRILVHTEGERRDFITAFGVSSTRVLLATHGARFSRNTQHDHETARASLGVPADALMFLTIGFIQESKGFDRAILAFAGLGARGARLDVVGRSRLAEDGSGYENHVDVLAAATDGVHRHKGFVSDELFDRWIVASDVVVLPYRNVWSSGVLERASLYDKEVIATRIGGLAEQAADRPGMTFVRDDAGLRRAMWERVMGARKGLTLEPWPAEGDRLRADLQRQIRRRAAAARGSRAASAAPVGAA
ncbi:MAG: glycosyltransferase family 4 protein, partial [Mycobacteriales bacterium]